MKRGFDKKLLYIFIGDGNLTKTTIAKKLFKDNFFETDSLEKHEIFNISKFNLNVDCIIIGGKYYNEKSERDKILKIIKGKIKNKHLIKMEFSSL